MNKNNMNLKGIIYGTIRHTTAPIIYVKYIESNIDKDVVEIIIKEIEEISTLDKMISICGGRGYFYTLKGTKEILNSLVEYKIFPIEDDENFYYFIY